MRLLRRWRGQCRRHRWWPWRLSELLLLLLFLLLEVGRTIAVQLKYVTLRCFDVDRCADRPLTTHSPCLLASICCVDCITRLIEPLCPSAVPNDPGWTLRI